MSSTYFFRLSSKRSSEWWWYTIPFLFGLCCICIYILQIPFNEGIQTIFQFLLTITSTAALGYFLNDVTDKKEDKLTGKSNVVASLSTFHIILIFILLSFFALAPWFYLPKSATNLSLYGLQIMLLLIYSIPPLRVKRFPIPAVIIDALYNSVVPLLVILSTFALISPEKVKIHPIIWCIVLAWAFLKGFRGILLHQVKDRKNDKKTSIRTFVLKYGPLYTIRLINRYVLPFELLIFTGIILYMSIIKFPFLWLIIPLFFLYLFLFFRLWERDIPWRKRETNFRYLYILNDLYEEWMPIILLCYLPFLDRWYSVLIPIHLLLFNTTVKKFVRNTRKNLQNFADYRKYLNFSPKYLNLKKWMNGLLFTFKRPFKKIYWYFHGHLKYYVDTYFRPKIKQ